MQAPANMQIFNNETAAAEFLTDVYQRNCKAGLATFEVKFKMKNANPDVALGFKVHKVTHDTFEAELTICNGTDHDMQSLQRLKDYLKTNTIPVTHLTDIASNNVGITYRNTELTNYAFIPPEETDNFLKSLFKKP